MNTDHNKQGTAQPAGEELKKHGDQLKKQVDAVAAQVPEQAQEGQQDREPEDRKE